MRTNLDLPRHSNKTGAACGFIFITFLFTHIYISQYFCLYNNNICFLFLLLITSIIRIQYFICCCCCFFYIFIKYIINFCTPAKNVSHNNLCVFACHYAGKYPSNKLDWFDLMSKLNKMRKFYNVLVHKHIACSFFTNNFFVVFVWIGAISLHTQNQ